MKKTMKLLLAALLALCMALGVLTACGGEKTKDNGKQVAVKFDMNYTGALTAPDAPASRTYIVGKAYGELPSPDFAGYTFAGWNLTSGKGSGTPVAAESKVETAIDHTLYARWKANTVKVSFDLQDGTVDGLPSYDGITVAVGESYGQMNIPDEKQMYKEDCTFYGWFLDAAGTRNQIFGSSYVTETADHTLYAVWKEITYLWDFEGGKNDDYAFYFGTAEPGAMHTGVELSIDERGEPGNHMLKIDATGAAYQGFTVVFSNLPPFTAGKTLSFEIEYAEGGQDVIFDVRSHEDSGANIGPGGRIDPLKPGSYKVSVDITENHPYLRLCFYYYDGYTERGVFWLDNVRISRPVEVGFDFDGGSGSPASKTVTAGKTYGTLPVPDKGGYAFQGWYTQAGGGGSLITAATLVTNLNSHTLHAYWLLSDVTVSFEANGGTGAANSITAAYNGVYGPLPELTKTDCRFAGWYANSTFTGGKITALSTVANTSNHTLYAKWLSLYEYEFDDEIDLEAFPAVWFEQGERLSLGTGANAGKLISTISGDTTHIAFNSEGINTAGMRVSVSVTITANVDRIHLMTPFDEGNGFWGSLVVIRNVSAGTYLLEFIFDKDNPDFSKVEGYDVSGAKLTNDKPIMIAVLFVNGGSQNVYINSLKFTPVIKSQVSFDFGGGSGSSAGRTVTVGNPYGTLPNPGIKTGYSFKGWFTESSGGTLVTASTIVTNASNHTLYAQWELSDITVSFDTDGAGTTPGITVAYGAAYGTLPFLTKSGCKFVGWYADSGFTGVKIMSATIVTNASNHTLYARWIADSTLLYEFYDQTDLDVFTPAWFEQGERISLGTGANAGKLAANISGETNIAFNSGGINTAGMKISVSVTITANVGMICLMTPLDEGNGFWGSLVIRRNLSAGTYLLEFTFNKANPDFSKVEGYDTSGSVLLNDNPNMISLRFIEGGTQTVYINSIIFTAGGVANVYKYEFDDAGDIGIFGLGWAQTNKITGVDNGRLVIAGVGAGDNNIMIDTSKLGFSLGANVSISVVFTTTSGINAACLFLIEGAVEGNVVTISNPAVGTHTLNYTFKAGDAGAWTVGFLFYNSVPAQTIYIDSITFTVL